MTFSKQLKQWRASRSRKENGLLIIGQISQREAAERLGVNLRTYQDWEQGRRTPRGIALQAVLERIK